MSVAPFDCFPSLVSVLVSSSSSSSRQAMVNKEDFHNNNNNNRWDSRSSLSGAVMHENVLLRDRRVLIQGRESTTVRQKSTCLRPTDHSDVCSDETLTNHREGSPA